MTICLTAFVNISEAAEYYCGDARYGYNNVNLYDSDYTAEQKCTWMFDNGIMSYGVQSFKQCVNNFKAAKIKFDKGLCTPIITKTHSWNGSNCQVMSIDKTPFIVRITCDINDLKKTDEEIFNECDAQWDYFGKLYRRQFGIYDVE